MSGINSFTVLMLHANGTDGSTSIPDSSASNHTMTAAGGAEISTTHAKFGTASIKCNNGKKVTTPDSADFDFGNGDFTVDFWVWFDDFGDWTSFLYHDAFFDTSWGFYYGDDGTLGFYYSTDGNATNSFGTGTNVATGAWTHIEVTRRGTSMRLFKNGVLADTMSVGTDTLFNSSAVFTIGQGGGNDFWVDEVRIAKGKAEHTTNFTLQTVEYSTDVIAPGIDSNTVLMAHGNGTNNSTTITDDSTSAHTLTVNGAAKILTAQSKFGGASLGFTGAAACYITTPDSADWAFGSGDFTIDFWMFPNNAGGSGIQILHQFANGGSSDKGWNVSYTGSNSLLFSYYYSGGSAVTATISGATIPTSAWTHVAIVRKGTLGTIYLNGIANVTFNFTASGGPDTLDDSTSPLILGGHALNTIFTTYNGYLDEVRISKGIARWTANFPVPTVEYSVGSSEIDDSFSASTLEAVSSVIDPNVNIIASIIDIFPATLEATSSVINPHYPTPSATQYLNKIISFNPLVTISDTTPIILTKIDTTVPSSPTYESFNIFGATGAKDVIYNEFLGYIYIACEDGKIVEVDATDFSLYTIIDTGYSVDFLTLAVLPEFFDLFAGTDLSTGEIIAMYEGTATALPMDIRFSGTILNKLDTKINTINGSKLSTDMRWSQVVTDAIGMDIRFINVPFNELSTNPIGQEDFHIWVDGVEIYDAKKDAINIRHNADSKSTATFILSRRHDKINYTLENTFSEITNKNHVQVYIQDHLEFDGHIWNVDCDSNGESITVTAYTDLPQDDERSLVNLSLPSLDEHLHVLHVLINNPSINNPYILASDVNPEAYNGIQIGLGTHETQNISRFASFGDIAALAKQITVDHTFVPKPNWTYFWFAQAKNFITGIQWATSNYIGTSPTSLTSDTWQVTGLSYFYQRQFPNDKYRLGTGTVYSTYFTAQEKAIGGSITNSNPFTYNGAYVDALEKSLETTNSTSTLWHNILSKLDENLGYYVGSAPFKKVSTQAGAFIPKDRWEDAVDGLYRHRDAGYDYTNYVTQIAALEYTKLQNINGSTLPITKADLEIFIDGYYFYNIKLLKRINVDNTTQTNIYKNNNGFPVSVKAIDISSSDMKITLSCDNQWSQKELLEIEATYPNPDAFAFPEQHVLNYFKFSPNLQQYVD